MNPSSMLGEEEGGFQIYAETKTFLFARPPDCCQPAKALPTDIQLLILHILLPPIKTFK